VVRHDNTFEIFIDQKSVRKGNLHEDLDPPVNPPKEIDDPADVKPTDWVDEPKINDPSASKPEDWDENAPQTIIDEDAVKPEEWCVDCPSKIPDPETEKPEDWDDESDGTWEAPLVDNPICHDTGCGVWERPRIPNPNFKGKWHRPQIPNPEYKGPWAARKIANPNYFEDENPHKLHPMGGVGFELWTMQESIEFDNIFIDTNEDAAFEFASQTWAKKHTLEKAKDANDDDGSTLDSIMSSLTDLSSGKLGILIAALIGVVTVVILLLVYCCSSGKDEAPPRREGGSRAHTPKDGKDPKQDGKDPKQDGKDPKQDGKDPKQDGKDPKQDGKVTQDPTEPPEDGSSTDKEQEQHPSVPKEKNTKSKVTKRTKKAP